MQAKRFPHDLFRSIKNLIRAALRNSHLYTCLIQLTENANTVDEQVTLRQNAIFGVRPVTAK